MYKCAHRRNPGELSCSLRLPLIYAFWVYSQIPRPKWGAGWEGSSSARCLPGPCNSSSHFLIMSKSEIRSERQIIPLPRPSHAVHTCALSDICITFPVWAQLRKTQPVLHTPHQLHVAQQPSPKPYHSFHFAQQLQKWLSIKLNYQEETWLLVSMGGENIWAGLPAFFFVFDTPVFILLIITMLTCLHAKWLINSKFIWNIWPYFNAPLYYPSSIG